MHQSTRWLPDVPSGRSMFLKRKSAETVMAGEYFDASVRTRLETGFIQTLGRALDSIDRARAAGHTCNYLANMSDTEIVSRGIQREDIPNIVIQQFLGPSPTHSGH